jgi:homoserine dehydrogenase
MNIAIVGFGVVGQAVARIACAAHRDLRITHVCNRHVARKRADWMPADVVWTEDFADVLVPSVDVVVELVGGRDPAGGWMRRALEAGKHVVTANKQLLAHEGAELLDLARARGRSLGFEASVAGGIPVIGALREGLAADRLHRISGILNGTCNYVLTRMDAAGVSFDEALAEAQAHGFAEADPTDDVDGLDARAKICILARVGLQCDVRPDQVACRSIRRIGTVDFVYAHRLACTIRQVSRVEVDPISGAAVAWVQPALVALSSALARVQGSQNLVVASGEFGGETGYAGLGAGGGPTAVAVVSDLLAISAGRTPTGGGPLRAVVPPLVTDRSPSRQYVRLVVHDRPGIIASLAGVLAAHGINIDAVLQEPGSSKAALPFVMTLEECDPHVLAGALAEIAAFDFHVEPPLALPMLDS